MTGVAPEPNEVEDELSAATGALGCSQNVNICIRTIPNPINVGNLSPKVILFAPHSVTVQENVESVRLSRLILLSGRGSGT
jgi:hypothetical protein